MPIFRAIAVLLCALPLAAQWTDLLKDQALSGWEKVGDGLWNLSSDHILVGERDRKSSKHQAWLYTKADYGQFDLEFDYWLRHDSNSGISVRDTSRGAYACGEAHDPKRTPSHIGYEIQIITIPTDRYPTGSLYLFKNATKGHERMHDWNRMEVRVRDKLIQVYLNGALVMEHPGGPERPKRGPIGLQLHDANTIVMFRNMRIREVP
jgi:hypothetical protein